MKIKPTRREFFSVAAIGTATALANRPATARIQEAKVVAGDDPVRIAVIGINGQGNALAKSMAGQPGARLDVLCDVDSAVLARRKKEFADRGVATRTVGDPRQVFDDDSIDAVVIATPNHLHSILSVMALEAGKHVYVEKPVSHVVKEGRAIVAAAAATGLVCQTGTHGRSSEAIRQAVEFAQQGGIGKISCSRGLCYKPRKSIGTVSGPQFAPSTVDYDRWLGPVSYQPLDRPRLHYDWHWNLHTGNGDLGNQGIHQMDIARWALNEDGLPSRVRSIGGRIGYVDAGDSPNTHIVMLDYDTAPLIFEVRGLPKNKAQQRDKWSMDRYQGIGIGNIIHGENGMVLISNNYSKAHAVDNDGKEIGTWSGTNDHRRNFVEAVRANDPTMLTAPIIEGHLSSACCHLGLVSHQVGEVATAEAIGGTFGHDALLGEAWSRMKAHITANEVDLAATPLTLGRTLSIDSAREAVIRDPEADALLTRTCREPHTFPNGLPA